MIVINITKRKISNVFLDLNNFNNKYFFSDFFYKHLNHF